MNIYFMLLLLFFFCFFFFFFYSVIILKTENRNSQPRIESADLRLCHRSRLGLLSIIALTILRKRNFGRLVCDNGCLPFIKKFRKFGLDFSVGKKGTCRLPCICLKFPDCRAAILRILVTT